MWLTLAALQACAPGAQEDTSSGRDADPLVVELAWYPSAADPDWDRARAGLWWALSNLGAAPPADEGGLEVLDRDERGVTFALDLGKVGFGVEHIPAVEAAVAPVRAWADGPVDAGRFLMATLYDPARYYVITGACPTLPEWRAAREAPDPLAYAVVVSLLVPTQRLVTFNAAGDDVAGLAWLSAEGEGSLVDGTFVPGAHETVDVMPNGQQRFAVYDDGGAIVAGSSGPTGQPGTCMWCHEMNVQRGTSANPGADGYLSYDAFVAEVERAEAAIDAVRGAGGTAIDWSYPVHEQAEQLTRAFLEPSAERVAREWGTSTEVVEALGLPTHESREFPDLGPLFDRSDVDAAYADRTPGWAPLPMPESDRAVDPEWPVDASALGCTTAEGER